MNDIYLPPLTPQQIARQRWWLAHKTRATIITVYALWTVVLSTWWYRYGLSWWQISWIVVTIVGAWCAERVVQHVATLQDLFGDSQPSSRNWIDRAKEAPPDLPGYTHLGSVGPGSCGDSPDKMIRVLKGHVFVHQSQWNTHALILGESGWGKSTVQRYLVYQFLKEPDLRIYFIEGKGDEDLAYSLVDMIAQARGVKVPLFTNGYAAPCTVYDMFRGTPEAIINRLAALSQIDLMTKVGDTDFHAASYIIALEKACFAPDGPPKSLEELYYRMRPDLKKTCLPWLKKAWAGDQYELDVIRDINIASVDGLNQKLNAFAGFCRQVIGNGGFAFEDEWGAVISLKISTSGFVGPRLARAFSVDFADLLGNRLRGPCAFFPDELAALEMENIDLLFSQARKFKARIIPSTQTVSNLSGYKKQDAIVQAPGLYFQMRTKRPEDILELTGYMKKAELSHQYRPEGEVAVQIRSKDDYIVDPAEVRQLGRGQGFLFYNNQQWKVQVPPPEMIQVPHSLDNIAKRTKIPYVSDDSKGGTSRSIYS